MEYSATFGIDCGISSGFGIKSPDNIERTETFSADNSVVAYQYAMHLAGKYADDYLSNPRNGLTTVQLLSLQGPDGAVSFDTSQAVVKRSMLEHFLVSVSRNKSPL